MWVKSDHLIKLIEKVVTTEKIRWTLLTKRNSLLALPRVGDKSAMCIVKMYAGFK